MSARRSMQRRSGATDVARSQPSRELPRYEPLLQPLNAAAQRKLNNLLNTHSSQALDDLLNKAVSILQDNVYGVTESVAADESNIARQKARYEKQGVPDEAEAERLQRLTKELEEMKTKVDQMSERMNASIKKVIDDQANLNSIRDSMTEVANDAMVDDMDVLQPRSSRRRPRNEDDDDDDDEEDDTYADFTPTDPAGGPTQTQPATQRRTAQPTKSFRDKLSRKREKYTSYTARQRYGNNNDYRAFRKGWHEAAYTDTAPPLPSESTWFAATQVPQPGVTTRSGAAASDSEDDIAVSRETISTRCPLTLAEFVDPVTSRKCPHSFEKSAIESLINESVVNGTQTRRGAAAAEKVVQCPVPACSSLLTLADLHEDMVLKRKIQRLQRAARVAEDEDEEHGREGVVEIGSDAPDGNGDGWGDDVDAERQRQRAKSVKQESSARQRRRERSVEM